MIALTDTEQDAIATAYAESAWQIGERFGMPVFSRRHLADDTRAALCGAKINWHYGNSSSNNTGPCARCYRIAVTRLI